MNNLNTENTYGIEHNLEILLHQIELSGGIIKEIDGTNFYEVDKPLELFEWAVSNRLLFHGSPELFKTIEPRQSQDTYRELGSLNAVYMSSHPETSMVKTILGNNAGGYSFKRDENGQILEMDIYTKDLSRLNEVGYMYILDPTSAEDMADGDYVSYKPVKPLAIVKFTKQDFKFPIEERDAPKKHFVRR